MCECCAHSHTQPSSEVHLAHAIQWSTTVVGRKTITINYGNNMHSGTVSSRHFSRSVREKRFTAHEESEMRERAPKRRGIVPLCVWMAFISRSFMLFTAFWAVYYSFGKVLCTGLYWCGGFFPFWRVIIPTEIVGREKRVHGDHHTLSSVCFQQLAITQCFVDRRFSKNASKERTETCGRCVYRRQILRGRAVEGTVQERVHR